jgi:hypothetical protein
MRSTPPGWKLLLAAGLLASGGVRAGAGEEIVLSRETCGGLFLVPLTWSAESGEDHDLLALFDTGAGGPTFIDPDAVERGSGRRVPEGARVRMSGVAAGEVRFTTFRPRVRELDEFSRLLGRELDVLLPFRTFEEFLLTLDYPRAELRISRDELPPPDGVEVFSARGPDRRPWLRLEISGRTRLMLIDSGSTGPLTVRTRAELSWRTPPLAVNAVQRFDGPAERRMGRLDEVVAIGPLTLERPLVSLTDGTELIGARVLAPLVASFDQKRRRVRLRTPAENPVRMPPHRGTGAVLWPRDDGLEVGLVAAGSPAEAAGVRSGDLVTAIDGVGVYERGCRPPGGPVADEERWTVRRGDATFEITVPVVDLVP